MSLELAKRLGSHKRFQWIRGMEDTEGNIFLGTSFPDGQRKWLELSTDRIRKDSADTAHAHIPAIWAASTVGGMLTWLSLYGKPILTPAQGGGNWACHLSSPIRPVPFIADSIGDVLAMTILDYLERSEAR